MRNLYITILVCLLALVGGTGAYGLMPTFMNGLTFLAISIFFGQVIIRYHAQGDKAVWFDVDKCVVLLLYIGFLVANFLKEVLFDTQYKFEEFAKDTNTIRQYIDMFRGLIAFISTSFIYTQLRNKKTFTIFPPICIAILLASMFLEAFGYISFNANIREGATWNATPMDLILARPGGFLNANLTAAIALVWLYVALESDINKSLLIKAISLILAVSVCTLAQSRAAVLFLGLYALYTIVVQRKGGFAISLLIGALGAIAILSYLDMDIVNSILEKFSARADKKEDSANERAQLLQMAIALFQDKPLTGHGLYYLHKEVGHSAHNQIAEILANFGLIGFFVFGSMYFTFYHKNAPSYLMLCIFPTMFFSHNFFENSALQVSLGFAYAQSTAGIRKIT